MLPTALEMEQRRLLLNLLDDLSDIDRRRLHFVLGNHIPRRLRDVSTVEGTLDVLEYLLDNDQISTAFVQALQACGRSDLAEKLQDFEQSNPVSIKIPHRNETTSTAESNRLHMLTECLFNDMSDEEDSPSKLSQRATSPPLLQTSTDSTLSMSMSSANSSNSCDCRKQS